MERKFRLRSLFFDYTIRKANGVQIFPWYGGECKRMVREASQPGIRDNLGNDLNAFNPSIMGIRSWLAGERSK